MSISTARGSTSDPATGILVAALDAIDGSLGIVAATARVGSKADYPVLSRTGIAAADSDVDRSTTGFAGAGGVNLSALSQSAACVIRAMSDTSGATLSGHVIGYDSVSDPLWEQAGIVFTASPRTLSAGIHPCVAFVRQIGVAVRVAFFVDEVSTGTWTVDLRTI